MHPKFVSYLSYKSSRGSATYPGDSMLSPVQKEVPFSCLPASSSLPGSPAYLPSDWSLEIFIH